ncbi:MAG: hypothetical protein LLF94_10685 [Chlamydiales bacterium]|nr:hypothetical protein [Chlamydiales bacterium]
MTDVQGPGNQPVQQPINEPEKASGSKPVKKFWRAGGSPGQNASPNFIQQLLASVKSKNVQVNANIQGNTAQETKVRNLIAFIDANNAHLLEGVFRVGAPSESLAKLNAQLQKNPASNLGPTKMQQFLQKFSKKPLVSEDALLTACNALKHVVNNTLAFDPSIGQTFAVMGKVLKESNAKLTIAGFEQIKNMPFTDEQRVILDLTIAYMAKVSTHSAKNKMDANNLAKILANAFADANPVTALQTEDDIRATLSSIIQHNANPANQPFTFIR